MAPQAGLARRLSWPDRARWRAFLKFMALFYVVFFPVYFGAGAYAARSGRALDLATGFERDIPLVPWMIWPYLSLFPLYLLVLFHMTPREMETLSRQSTLSLLVAGVAFVLIPGRLIFPPAEVRGLLAPLFELLGAADTPHNLAPSLHVASAGLILLGCAELGSSLWLARGYRVWLAVMSAAAVLVHQHHLLDIATGFLLAVAVRRLSPFSSGSPAPEEPARRDSGEEADARAAQAAPDDAFLNRRDHRIV